MICNVTGVVFVGVLDNQPEYKAVAAELLQFNSAYEKGKHFRCFRYFSIQWVVQGHLVLPRSFETYQVSRVASHRRNWEEHVDIE